MSAFPPSQRASRRLRLSAFGLAVACSVGIAAPSAAVPLTATTGTVAAPGATDPNKAKKQVDKEIESLKQQLDDTSVALQNTYFALRRTQAALPVAQPQRKL